MRVEEPNPKGILIRGVNWIGDAVMSMPAVYQLRQKFPSAKIYLLTLDKLSELWVNNPEIDEIITISRSESPFGVAKMIKNYNVDLAIVFPNSFRSAFEMWLAGIPQRVGFGFGLRSLLLTTTVKPPHEFVKIKKLSKRRIKKIIAEGGNRYISRFSQEHHHIYNYLRIVGAVGVSQELVEPRIVVNDDEIEQVKQKFDITRLCGRRILGINPGAEYGVAKRWFPERFVDATIQIHRNTQCGILILGGKNDADYCKDICGEIKSRIDEPDCVINLASKTTLKELCAVLKLCNVLISNDTGPAHIAAAVGSRVVAIFASTSPELTAPGLPGSSKHIVIRSSTPCSPCFRRECPIDFRCMNEIPVEKVVQATLSILNKPQ